MAFSPGFITYGGGPECIRRRYVWHGGRKAGAGSMAEGNCFCQLFFPGFDTLYMRGRKRSFCFGSGFQELEVCAYSGCVMRGNTGDMDSGAGGSYWLCFVAATGDGGNKYHNFHLHLDTAYEK